MQRRRRGDRVLTLLTDITIHSTLQLEIMLHSHLGCTILKEETAHQKDL